MPDVSGGAKRNLLRLEDERRDPPPVRELHRLAVDQTDLEREDVDVVHAAEVHAVTHLGITVVRVNSACLAEKVDHGAGPAVLAVRASRIDQSETAVGKANGHRRERSHHDFLLGRPLKIVRRLVPLLLVGCSFVRPDDDFPASPEEPDAAPEPVLPPPDDTGAPPWCENLECQIVNCGGGASTNVTGTVYAPNGTLPLYNVVVYVPNRPLDPISTKPACCVPVSGKPIATTVTDARGRFVLKGVPVGTNIPIVLQIGKWRRGMVLPQVKACVDNPLAAGTVRLPKNGTEGNLPRIAATMGACDPLGCILPKLGIDAVEVGVLQGPSVWNDLGQLQKWDAILLASECAANESNKTNPPPMQQYVDQGGRIYASGSQSTWASTLVSGWKTTAAWGASVTASAPFSVNVTFPKGKAMADWLGGPEVGALKNGALPIAAPNADVGAVTMPTTRWIAATGGATSLLSFNAPVNMMPSKQCGRFTYAGMNVASGSVDPTFPTGCAGALGPEEKALAFLLFDVPSCW